MNDAQVDTLEAGRELDAMIAEKVMGLNVLGKATTYRPEGTWVILGNATNNLCDWHEINPVYLSECFCDEKDSYSISLFGHTPFCMEVVPFYSTDIAAAMLIWDKFIELGYAMALIQNKEDGCSAKVFYPGESLRNERGDASTKALAICKAALKVAR